MNIVLLMRGMQTVADVTGLDEKWRLALLWGAVAAVIAIMLLLYRFSAARSSSRS